jgi:hypothetical protein
MPPPISWVVEPVETFWQTQTSSDLVGDHPICSPSRAGGVRRTLSRVPITCGCVRWGSLNDNDRMRLSRSDRVADLPATDARKLMRRFGDAQPESMISSLIDTGNRTDAEVASALADAGYLSVHSIDQDGQTWWEATIQGNALGQASFAKPISRATAEHLLAGVIERAQTFNADGSHVVDIVEVVVFGSYLDPDMQHLGDLDLAVVIRDRVPDFGSTGTLSAIRLGYANASGRRFSTLFERLSWPDDEALLILGNRTAAINITLEDVRTLTDRWEAAYTYDA